MRLDNAELFSLRTAMRELNHLILRLESGELSKVVLMKGSEIKAVVLTYDEYQRLEREVKGWR